MQSAEVVSDAGYALRVTIEDAQYDDPTVREAMLNTWSASHFD